jgi:IS5 family transposase
VRRPRSPAGRASAASDHAGQDHHPLRPGHLDQLNDALLAKANEHKLVKLDKLRADTTVVEANVAYPTESGLLAHAVTLLVTLVARVHTAGGATRTTVRDRRRAAIAPGRSPRS